MQKHIHTHTGESYMDITLRLEPLTHDLERTREPILIVGHQGIHRILYAYFMGLTREEAPYVQIPLNHVIILRPHAVSKLENEAEQHTYLLCMYAYNSFPNISFYTYIHVPIMHAHKYIAFYPFSMDVMKNEFASCLNMKCFLMVKMNL
jgi:hypothetical protein